MLEESVFYQLSAVIVIAAVVSLVLRIFRQPLIIGYILTGIIVGPSALNIIKNHEAFTSFSEIGIVLLLFIIGLGLNITIIKDAGKPVFLTFLAILLGVGGTGFAAGYLLGFGPKESLIMATALLFSSTIIVVKVLSDKKEQSRLYGQIAIGILLVEDIFATLALLALSASAGGSGTSSDLVMLIAKGVVLGVLLFVVGAFIMPRLSKLFAASQELLYVFALAWAFGIASLFYWAGFSIEVGALFAGVSVAHLPYVQAIATRLKPLRDFFIVIFFIQLGESLNLNNLSNSIVPALVFSALVMITKPLIIMSSLGALGYTKQTGFKSAMHLSQISEFSIVLVVLAISSGFVSKDLAAVVTLTALITIALSAYLMKYDDRLFRRFEKQLSLFERTKTKKEVKALGNYPLMLLGYREGGYSFVQTFRDMKKDYIVIDYDPDVIELLERQHISHLYGDVTDTELLDEIGVHKSEMIISTITSPTTNRMLANHISKANSKAIFICHAAGLDEAEELYEAGATYVLMPHFIGDEHINQFVKRNGTSKRAYAKYRVKHLSTLGNLAVTRT